MKLGLKLHAGEPRRRGSLSSPPPPPRTSQHIQACGKVDSKEVMGDSTRDPIAQKQHGRGLTAQGFNSAGGCRRGSGPAQTSPPSASLFPGPAY